ncbi:hypothetical protein HY357_01210 [Candidatus Roizmanbacteria bacterium]|nr:hypothetical protein [Candidatus Roizmanbacteria bacterium]
MKLKNKRSILNVICVLFLFVILVPVIISIIQSGYYYTYDRDEITHIQKIYLMATGVNPYVSFYSSFTPVFHAVFIPLFLQFGFSFQTIDIARIVMIILFAMRIGFFSLAIAKIFNKRIAVLFIPLYLFDPFTIFVSMQIRPDNLMITIFSLGFLLFIFGLFKSSKILLFLSGSLFSISALILFKMVPAIVIVVAVFFIYSLKKNKLAEFWIFLSGFILSCGFFLVYFILAGSFIPMFQQVFVLSPLFASSAKYITTFGFFNQPNNAYIYGLMGRPFIWAYVWVLPLLAAAGAYSAIIKLQKDSETKKYLRLTLVLLAIFQYVALLVINQIFIQYYIPLQWLLAMFAAVLIEEIGWAMLSGLYRLAFFIGLFIFFLKLSSSSIETNKARATFNSSSNDFVSKTQKLWSLIPERSASFPNILFRPLGYPLEFGYEEYRVPFPPQIKALMPEYAQTFEKNKVHFLRVEDAQQFFSIEDGLQEYVEKHYKLIDPGLGLWQREE